MVSRDKTYSNRQVKGTEDLFAADDPDAYLVGGVNQPAFGVGANLVINNAIDGVLANAGNQNTGGEDDEPEDPEDPAAPAPAEPLEPPAKPGTVTKVTFTQVNKFTPNGTFLADVIAEIEDVKGARDYEVKFYKIS